MASHRQRALTGIVRLAVMLAILLAVLACAGGGGGGATSGGAAPAAKPAEKASTESLVVAAALPLTGTAATFGPTQRAASEMAIEKVNAAGGVLGRKLTMEVQDYGATPEVTVNAAQKLFQSKPIAMIGIGLSPQVQAVAPLVREQKVPLLHIAASPALEVGKSKDNEFLFRMAAGDTQNIVLTVDYAVKKVGGKRIALMYDDTVFGKSWADVVVPMLTKQGLEPVVKEQMSNETSDVSAQLTHILDAKPDVVLEQLWPKENAVFLREAKKRGLNVPIIAGKGFLYAIQGGVVTMDEAEGIVVGVDSGDLLAAEPAQDVKDWMAELSKRNSSAPPGEVQAETYDSILLMADALTRANITDPTAFVGALRTTKSFTAFKGIKAVVGPYGCDADQNCFQGGSIVQIKGGKWTVIPRS